MEGRGDGDRLATRELASWIWSLRLTKSSYCTEALRVRGVWEGRERRRTRVRRERRSLFWEHVLWADGVDDGDGDSLVSFVSPLGPRPGDVSVEVAHGPRH